MKAEYFGYIIQIEVDAFLSQDGGICYSIANALVIDNLSDANDTCQEGESILRVRVKIEVVND